MTMPPRMHVDLRHGKPSFMLALAAELWRFLGAAIIGGAIAEGWTAAGGATAGAASYAVLVAFARWRDARDLRSGNTVTPSPAAPSPHAAAPTGQRSDVHPGW